MDKDKTPEYIEISGTVESVLFSNEENGYTVLRMETQDGEKQTVTGCLPFAAPGEMLTVGGVWTHHASYGRQFKAEYATRTVPSGTAAIYEYLAGRTLKGIGPATAMLIVNRFGDRSLDIIENHPEQLAEIRGISMSKAKEICLSYRKQMGIRLLMEFLTAHGLRPGTAMRLYRFYGDAARGMIQENPYILASEHIGAGFAEADKLAMELGFEADAPERVSAAVIFELTHNLNNGHTFIPVNKLMSATAQLIGVEPELVEECMDALLDSGDIVIEQVANVRACYLPGMREAESDCAMRLRAMAAAKTDTRVDIEKAIAKAGRAQGITYTAQQEQTLRIAAKRRVCVITGGPGTGKTTTVRAILNMFDCMGLTTLLTAPTGRAAKRMTELTGREASTVHRLLGAGYAEGSDIVFQKDEDQPLEGDAVIMDECSMVDITLMAALLRALPEECRLVLVGDADQLPSVGPGNVFRDIIRSGVVETVRLTEVFRQTSGSSIIRNAHMINRGEHPELTENRGDFFFMRRRDAAAAADTIVSLCRDRLPKNMGIPAQDIQVLTPTRLYEAGTRNLNQRLQEALNPPGPDKAEKKYGDMTFRVGDKVMQSRNNYDIIWATEDKMASGSGIFNGDVGVIRSIDPNDELVTVDFDGKLAKYGVDMLSELEHAFAMTVHKSQGSEYRAVVLALAKMPRTLATRGLLYTAITRARELLVIVGNDEAVDYMIDNHKQAGRYSGLRFRLAEGAGA